jgi:hypothetical protein
MKKFLTIAILSISTLAFVPSVEAKTGSSSTAATVAAEPQIIIRTPNRRYQRRARVTTSTRNVRRGRFLYRETYRTTYRPNGRVVTRLISRVRIGRY